MAVSRARRPAIPRSAPPVFGSTPARWREFRDELYTLQVAPEDCTGCSLCVHVCPAVSKEDGVTRALEMQPQAPLREQEKRNWDFFLALPDPPGGGHPGAPRRPPARALGGRRRGERATGARGVRAALDAYRAAGDVPGVRHRIEHIETLQAADLPRFAAEGEPYKVELVDTAEGDISLYTQSHDGSDAFTDLCRGPHLQDSKPIQALKLTGLAGDGLQTARRSLMMHLDEARAGAFSRTTRLAATEVSQLCISSMSGQYPWAEPQATADQWGSRALADRWVFTSATRYCPQCLAGDGSYVQQQHGGAWQKAWRPPVAFPCPAPPPLPGAPCPPPRLPVRRPPAGDGGRTGQANPDGQARRRSRLVGDDVGDEPLEEDRLTLDLEPGLHPAQGQQVLDDPVEPVRLGLDVGQDISRVTSAPGRWRTLA